MAPALSQSVATVARPHLPDPGAERVSGVIPAPVQAFIDLAGPRRWAERVRELQRLAAGGPRAGRAERQRQFSRG